VCPEWTPLSRGVETVQQ